ncbi:ODV-E56 [Spodoptera frugiperda multiple nucleopolyhedrovirus]|uniref:ODV-E56 n=1 Tax=Spodoptera frugiperda nuclear polyhedrosis virus TaxID=10455 RepID=B2KWU2_NPVSF|nr:ODV-E56 [Spodoptera frugiperda multiple nucleopolyhedrovirus]ACA02566.1 ODV-E56 [Spodoptera frugiperda multiple nucleopolyhedrovirus]ACV50440.1 ODV-E56 [Spodoptera frugiperda multiple nucleopolyhedrovirus]ADV91240.1 ODV-E56 [Spodoptera frugiperda multiple nucleopolyhedrovirus]AFH58969.1 odv-e56 [Spodoptera frugiperda multiple nucleopolyhedrovirus]QED39922.1 ODV-E56 [Spodoptera frugiperda multiple nucleopolyhedrovirus]
MVFRPLRNVNKTYSNITSFVADNNSVVNASPSGFRNVLNKPTSVPAGNNQIVPGYNLPNNNFISTSELNSIMRNNDTNGMRRVFGNTPTNNDYNSLTQIRRADNIPDANMHSKQLKRDAVKNNNPSTRTNTPEGIQNSLNQNPSLNDYLQGMKTAGKVALLGVGVYLTFEGISLIQDIREALARTGGSYHTTGIDGGNEVSVCLLRYRTCRLPDVIDNEKVTICRNDPLIADINQLQNICANFNYEEEGSVCRASDPNANPDSPQYLDISNLGVDQMINCIEPYDFGDLIADLGLDGLLGENGLFTKSSNSSKSISDSLLPAILMIGIIIFIVFIGYFIFKRLGNTQTQTIQLEPIRTSVPMTSVPIQVVR